jgi:hypothetical protein
MHHGGKSGGVTVGTNLNTVTHTHTHTGTHTHTPTHTGTHTHHRRLLLFVFRWESWDLCVICWDGPRFSGLHYRQFIEGTRKHWHA